MNAKASLDLAEAEFNRIKSLLDQKVVSQSEFDQRRRRSRPRASSTRSAQNGAEQSYRSLQAARARVALARKAVADTSVRAPFAGLVAERLVSVGDYVTRGHEGRHGRAHRSAARRADGPRAVRLARQGRPAGAG